MTSTEAVKFLLVDDIDENLSALEALLRRDGLELFKARSGREALELLLVHDFALALLDVQMPEMDGFELAELMRGTERTRRIPIIFLTAVATDETWRFRRYESGAVDYLLKPLDPRMLASKAEVFFELGLQKLELARQRDELRRTAITLAGALSKLKAHDDNSPLAIVEFSPDLQLLSWSKGAERMFGWNAPDVVGKRLSELRWMHDEDAEVFATLVDEMLADKQPRDMRMHRTFHRNGAVLECEWYFSVLLDSAGKPLSINAQILDVTQRKRAEETRHLLIGELNHRVKNTLASVQAIANQTLRHTQSPADFAAKFTGRIQALARAHSLLSSATWQGANLKELIQDQCQLGTIDEARLTALGPSVELEPQMALHMALVLHELGTNAAKYGALSTEEGRIDLNWTIQDGTLHLMWRESGGPAVQPPSRRGFGTMLLERSLKSDGGTVQGDYAPEGVTWKITLPTPDPAEISLSPPLPNPASTARRKPPRNWNVNQDTTGIAGKRFLVIEDEALVAFELASILEDAGAIVEGPAGSAGEALRIIESTALDGAFLDGNLNGETVDDVAAALTRREVPFLFVSGYERDHLPPAFSDVATISKPFSPADLISAAQDVTRSSVREPAMSGRLPKFSHSNG